MAIAQESPVTIAPKARAGDPCIVVIFGAAGDLTKRKLVPALYNLLTQKLLADRFAVMGVTSAEYSDPEFRAKLSTDIREFATTKVDDQLWNWFDERVHYVAGDFHDPNLYQKLKTSLAAVDKEQHTSGNYLFYLATAPQFFGEIIGQLGRATLTTEENGRWRRVIIEKPFGRDLDSARALNKEIKKTLDEGQIYRIDHYLGKETVQNMMVFRFGNGIFEPVWNRRYIDHVQITAAETVGVELRGGYYDQSGALRDMVPNHTLQLVAMSAMEPPISFDSEAVRDEKAKILHAIQQLSPEDVLAKAVRATEIAIQFKRAPQLLFRGTEVESLSANQLVMHIQPDEGISLGFSAKIPGAVMNLGAVNMNMKYEEYFGAAPWTGYETLLLDCMIGDP